MVVNRDVVLYEELMLKQSAITVVLDTEVKSFSQDKIQVDIEKPPVSQRKIVSQQ